MKVLYYTDSLRIGGKERQLVELLKGLKQQHGLEVLLVCMDKGEFYESDVRILGIPLRYVIRRTRWDPIVITELWRIVREFRPDVIHTNSMMSSAYALPIAKLFGLPLINGSIRNCFHRRTIRWRVERGLLALSDVRIANSEAGLRSRGFSPDSSKNVVIHNGIDLFRAISGGAKLIGIEGDYSCVGMTAEFRPDKDFRTFLLAARQLIAVRSDVHFIAVGDGETFGAMKALVADAGEGIQFLGRRKDVEAIVRSFSIGVLATFTEGISNSIMEYMAMGKPVVATDCEGSREIVRDGENGFLVPPQDPAALAEKIAYLLDHPQEAKRMGEAGRRHIETHFSLKNMVDKTVEVYKQTIARSYGRQMREAVGSSN